MLDPNNVPTIAPEESATRFVLSSRWIRSSDNSVKPEAYMPHLYTELSVTRHLQATIDEIWTEGDRIASLQHRTLYGRADVLASTFTDIDLALEPDPIEYNPNHANITKWPVEKPEQKIKAIEIANRSEFVSRTVES